MALVRVIVVAVAVGAVCFGVRYASTHSASEVDAYLARSRSIRKVLLPVALGLIAVGVLGLALTNAL